MKIREETVHPPMVLPAQRTKPASSVCSAELSNNFRQQWGKWEETLQIPDSKPQTLTRAPVPRQEPHGLREYLASSVSLDCLLKLSFLEFELLRWCQTSCLWDCPAFIPTNYTNATFDSTKTRPGLLARYILCHHHNHLYQWRRRDTLKPIKVELSYTTNEPQSTFILSIRTITEEKFSSICSLSFVVRWKHQTSTLYCQSMKIHSLSLSLSLSLFLPLFSSQTPSPFSSPKLPLPLPLPCYEPHTACTPWSLSDMLAMQWPKPMNRRVSEGIVSGTLVALMRLMNESITGKRRSHGGDLRRQRSQWRDLNKHYILIEHWECIIYNICVLFLLMHKEWYGEISVKMWAQTIFSSRSFCSHCKKE